MRSFSSAADAASFMTPSSRDIGGTDALQREPKCNAFIDDSTQLLGQRDARVAGGQRRQAGEPLRDFTSAREQPARRDDFVHGAPFPGRRDIKLLPGKDEVAAAYCAYRLLPEQMHPIAGRDTKLEMGLVLEYRRWSGQDDVAQQDIFRVQPNRTVHSRN